MWVLFIFEGVGCSFDLVFSLVVIVKFYFFLFMIFSGFGSNDLFNEFGC